MCNNRDYRLSEMSRRKRMHGYRRVKRSPLQQGPVDPSVIAATKPSLFAPKSNEVGPTIKKLEEEKLSKNTFVKKDENAPAISDKSQGEFYEKKVKKKIIKEGIKRLLPHVQKVTTNQGAANITQKLAQTTAGLSKAAGGTIGLMFTPVTMGKDDEPWKLQMEEQGLTSFQDEKEAKEIVSRLRKIGS